MNAIVLEHVKVSELPEAWRSRLTQVPGAIVTVRIEAEGQGVAPIADLSSDDLLFGMWRDRQDMLNVPDYIRLIRASRFNQDDTQRTD